VRVEIASLSANEDFSPVRTQRLGCHLRRDCLSRPAGSGPRALAAEDRTFELMS
jgi:hypothetical protein